MSLRAYITEFLYTELKSECKHKLMSKLPGQILAGNGQNWHHWIALILGSRMSLLWGLWVKMVPDGHPNWDSHPSPKTPVRKSNGEWQSLRHARAMWEIKAVVKTTRVCIPK